MVLYSERNRRRMRDQEEARGEVFWSTEFPESTRRKIAFAGEDSVSSSSALTWATAQRRASDLILRTHGWEYLTIETPYGTSYGGKFWEYMYNVGSAVYPDVVESIFKVLDNSNARRKFSSTVQTILREDRVSFDFVDGLMIPFESQEMHTAVVLPVITLLAGRKSFAEAEASYLKALEEITRGDAGDAITDAGTALQLTLEALGCKGNALGPLIKDAKRRGLVAGHDSTLTDGIEKILHWVSADRSESGDAHKATDASIEDAWLIVHVVGALILRLAGGPLRGVGSESKTDPKPPRP